MARIAIWRSEQNLTHPRLGNNLQWGAWGFYGAQEILRQLGVTFDVVEDGQIDDYELLICPDIPLVTQEQRKRLEDFVKAGGKILTDGTFSLYQDARLTPYPDDDDLLGIHTQANQVNPYHDSGEPNYSGHIIHAYDQGPVFEGLPCLLPAFGRTRILIAQSGAQARGTFEGILFKGTAGNQLQGSACILKEHGRGLSLCVSARIFRTIGLLLSSQTSPDLWVSRTEYFPSADNTGGVHGWEHNAICRTLRATGWGDFPLGAYYQRFVLNLINFLCPNLPRVSFYPDGKRWVLVITYDVDHANESCWYFDRWRELNRELGIHPDASWLFQAHLKDTSVYPHPSLSGYDIDDPEIKSVIAQLKEDGYEIGLHHCDWDGETIRQEYARFKDATGFAPLGTRGHYLVDSPDMMESLESAGLVWDGSWFNHQELATMSGVYHPVHPLNCRTQEALSILELSSLFTEGMQTWDMYGLHPPITNERLAATMEMLKELGGIWVPGIHQRLLPISEGIYRYLITKAKEHQAWITTGEKLTQWWLAREHIRIEQSGEDTLTVRYDGPAELLPYTKGATLILPGRVSPIKLEDLDETKEYSIKD